MFDSLTETRRSIRKFLKRPVEAEIIEKIARVTLRAPSSRGLSPWELVVLTDPVLLEKLSVAKEHGASFLKDAPLGIVVVADPTKCDVWIEDASIAATFLLLAAHDMGLGACWIQIRERRHSESMTAEAYVRRALGIPDHLRVEAIVAIGYPGEKKSPHRGKLPLEKVRHNSYDQPLVAQGQ